MGEHFAAYLVTKTAESAHGGVSELNTDDLPEGDVLIRVAWSSLNYKDALAAKAHPGVVRQLPHVPGIDAAGTVVDSRVSDYVTGQSVLVTGHELGAARWGGWSQLIRVPASWVVPLPPAITLREAMIYGTAGFTAAQCVRKLQQCEITPDIGPIIVTGATGGVGCMAIGLLSRLGYHVVASTGKSDQHDWLRELGAAEVVSRERFEGSDKQPLRSARWAGAVDTVGGATLETLLRETQPFGCITACGLVGGADLTTTVYPLILRGVTLAGISASLLPDQPRREIWNLLSGPWRLENLEQLSRTIELPEVADEVRKILAGQIRGRVVIRIVAGRSTPNPQSR